MRAKKSQNINLSDTKSTVLENDDENITEEELQ